MSIIKDWTSPNGATAAFHRVRKIEITAAGVTVTVGSWPTEEAYGAIGEYPVWVSEQAVPPGTTLLSIEDAEAWCVGPTGPLADGTAIASPAGDVAARRVRQKALIKAERERREFGGFVWDGSAFDSTPASVYRIIGAVALAEKAVAAGETFARVWRLRDDTFRTLSAPDVVAVGLALGQHVAAVFDTWFALDAAIAASTEPESVTWPADAS